MLDLGLHALDHAVAVIVLQREVEARDLRAVAVLASGDQINRVGGVAPTDLEGVTARLQEARVADGYGLHVAGDAGVADGRAVGRTGEALTVGETVDALDHVALRP